MLVLLAASGARADQDHCLLSRRTVAHLKSDGALAVEQAVRSDRGTASNVACQSYMQTEGCAWTVEWNCPDQGAGSRGPASPDLTIGYDCCCAQELWRQASPSDSEEEEDQCQDYIDSTGCDWTLDWNCPGQSGGLGTASADASLGYSCCCTQELWETVGRTAVASPNVETAPAVQQPRPVAAKMPSEASDEGEPQTFAQPASECSCDQEAVCMLWGDPHIYVFDGKRQVRFLEHGDFWIVNSSSVSIQGRYAAGGPQGQAPAVIQALAIGGDFLQGRILTIEAGGQTLWNGQPILEAFPSTFEEAGLITARYDDDSEHIDPGLRNLQVKSIEARLPMGVRVTVNRWPDHLDVLLAMRPLPGGQDGHCGNFNGDAADDSAELIRQRTGAQVSEDDLLFSVHSPASPMVSASIEDCPPDLRERAEQECVDATPVDRPAASADAFLQSCIMDVCFAGDRFAREDAVIEEQMTSRANASLSTECSCGSTSAPTPAPTPAPTATPTPAPTPAAPRRTCFLFGDPHVVSFDAAAEAQAGRELSHSALWAMERQRIVTLVERECQKGCGLHWLVKSADVHIQASYADRWSWLESLAIGGPFLKNHTLIVDKRGHVRWDRTTVVDEFPATFSNEFVRLRYFKNHIFQSITNTPRKLWRHTGPGYVLQTMMIDLPQGVTLSVNVGNIGSGQVQFLDVFITMPRPESGVDGHCGKADDDLSDDNNRRFMERIDGLRVTPEQSLWGAPPQGGQEILFLQEEATAQDSGWDGDGECHNGTREDAWLLCEGTLPSSASVDWLTVCADDVCAAGDEMAMHTVMLAAQTEELYIEEQKAVEAAEVPDDEVPVPIECHTCAPGDDCFQDVKWAMQTGISNGQYSTGEFTPMIDASSCFEEVQAALRAWQRAPNFTMGGMADQSVPAPCAGQPEPFEDPEHGLTYCR